MDSRHPNSTDATALDLQRSDLSWLRGLARELIGDPALADDACQEAWLASFRRGEAQPNRHRLRLDLRRFAWRWRRSETGRRRREQSVAHPESLPSTEEMLQRSEESARLWARLAEMEEPYRTTLLLRFQEGHEAREIAERQGLPVDTVRKRLRRGLELLRSDLRRRGQFASLALLFPLSPRSTTAAAAASSTTVPLGGLLMAHLTVANSIFAAGVLVLGGALAWGVSGSRPDISEPDIQSVSPAPVELASEALPSSLHEPVLSFVSPSRAAFRATEELERELVRVCGRVVSAGGTPLPGLQLTLSEVDGWTRETTTAEDGRFVLTPPVQTEELATLTVEGSPFLEKCSISFGADQDNDHAALVAAGIRETDLGDVLLRKAGTLIGRLVDGAGRGVPGGFAFTQQSRLVQAGTSGEFELERLLPGSTALELNVPGCLRIDRVVTIVAEEQQDLGDVECTKSPRVTGQVVDTDGRPIPKARVYSDGRGAPGWSFDADEQGCFDIPLPVETGASVFAVARGFETEERSTAVHPGEQDVVLALRPSGVLCTVCVRASETGAAIEHFGYAIEKGRGAVGGSPHDRRHIRLRDRPEGVVKFYGTPLVDRLVVEAAGYRLAVLPLSEAATSTLGQVLELERIAGLHGRIVCQDVGVPGAEVRIWFGELGANKDPETQSEHSRHPGSPLRKVMRQQMAWRFFNVAPVEEAMDAPVPGERFFWPKYSRTTTDEGGRFFMPSCKHPVVRVEAVTPRGLIARSGLMVTSPDFGTDIGDLEATESVVLRGTIVPRTESTLEGHTILVGDEQATTNDRGEFEIVGLARGGHYVKLKEADGLRVPEFGHPEWFVRLTSGEPREIELEVETVIPCLLNFVVTHNGRELSGGRVSCWLPRSGVIGVDLDEWGRGQRQVPAGVPIQCSVQIQGVSVSVGDALIFPAGEDQVVFEASSASLSVALPEGLELPDDVRVSLAWNHHATSGSMQIESSGDRKTGEFSFPVVPVHAQGLRVKVRGGRVDGENAVDLEFPLNPKFEAGVHSHVALKR